MVLEHLCGPVAVLQEIPRKKALDKPDKTLMVWERRGRSQFCRILFSMDQFKSKSELAFLKTKAMKKETVYNFDIIICRKPSCPPKCFCVVTCALLTKRMVKEGWILVKFSFAWGRTKIEWRPINRQAQNRPRPKSSHHTASASVSGKFFSMLAGV